MDYNSFYGGRRGASFVIVKSFPSIEEMANAFVQGGDYKTVNYDEYVIIDTVNKNDKDNGKIYRRGYNYSNDASGLGGAEYVGQIVGPAGMAPHVEMTTIAEVEELANEENLTLVDSTGEHLYRKTEGSYAPTDNLVPGQYYDEDGNEQFNDEIQYMACSVKDENSHISTAHIGFIFPYHVNQFTAETVSPYYHRSDAASAGDPDNWEETGDSEDFDNQQLITRTDDLSHPYFAKWDIKIPKGIKGDVLKNFRVTTVAECEAEHPGWLQNYDGRTDDENTQANSKERKILVYDYYHYDKDASGEPVSIYLGDYNQIKNFTINPYGTVQIDYTHDNRDTYKNLFKWIKTIDLDPKTGHFIIEYNYDKTRDGSSNAKADTTIDMYLTWLKDVSFDDEGTITWNYTTAEDDKSKKNLIKWIDSMSLNAETGAFDIEFNYPTEPDYKENAGAATRFHQDLQWVKNITIAEDGTVNFDYTSIPDVEKANLFKWVKSVSLDKDTGKFIMEFNYENEPEYKDAAQSPTKIEKDLTWVKDIIVEKNGTIKWVYTTPSDNKEYLNLLKWIDNVELDNETGTVTFVYNNTVDPNNPDDTNKVKKDIQLRYVKDVEIMEDGSINFIYTTDEKIEYNNIIKTVSTMTMDPETGEFTIIYNTPDVDDKSQVEKFSTRLDWVKDIEINADGDLIMKHTVEDDTIYKDYVRSITDITLNETTGAFHLEYNIKNADGTPQTLDKTLKWINDITIGADGKVVAHYTTGDTKDLSYLNSIEETVISDKYHLLIYYSSPVKRQAAIDAGTAVSYNGKNGWIDLGSIKDYNGILIGANIDSTSKPNLETTAGAIEFLNTTYPNGLTDINNKGKVVTIGSGDNDKRFYAFDYETNTWFFLGDLSGIVVLQDEVEQLKTDIKNVQSAIVGREDDISVKDKADKLPNGSLWFIVEGEV